MPAWEMHLLAGFEELLAGFFPCYSPLQHSLGDREETGILKKQKNQRMEIRLSIFTKWTADSISYRATSYLCVPNMDRGFWWCRGAL